MNAGRWLAILGIGEDGVEGLAPRAQALLRDAASVFGGVRHLALVSPLIRGERHAWPTPIADALPAIAARRGTATAVLASGDPNWFGIGALLARAVPAEETLCLPAPSAFSLACARLGWALQDVTTISFCGRKVATLRPLLQPGARILALSADAATPAAVAALLRERGFGDTAITVLEALGGPRERCRTECAERFAFNDVDPLNLLALRVRAAPGARVLPLAAGLDDALFETDGQLSKSEVRAITLAALAPRRGEMLWDIGCGSGSIGIEWMLRDPANRAVGIEARPDRAARAARNATALGVPGLDVRVGAAPAALAGLPRPDAVFVGGGGGDCALLRAGWEALATGGRLVANGVTVETEAVLLAAWRDCGGMLRRIAVERLDAIGGFHTFRPAMTVTQWAATKP